MSLEERNAPIEVWLRKNNLKVTCEVVHEDESTETLDVESLSLRGAEREITGYLIAQGYAPVGRWQDEVAPDYDEGEVSRKFRPKKPAVSTEPLVAFGN